MKRKKKKHILIAEDEAVTRKNLAKVLRDTGYVVMVAKDGEEAIRQVLSNPPDLALTNLQMPKLDGMDVLTRIRQIEPNVPVLLVTALVTPQTRRRARRLGLGDQDFIEKPFDFDDLLGRIDEVLAS